MKAALLLAVAIFASASAQAVDLRARSTSSSRQFTVYCDDVALRGRVTGFVEEAKRDVLEFLGERDRWRIPIVITLERAIDPAAVETPVTLRLAQTPDGPTIQLGVSIGNDPAIVHLQRHIMRAIMLDFIYRDRLPQPGEPYVDAPWWFISGVIEKVRQRDLGINSDVYERLIQVGKLPGITDALNGFGQELGGTWAAFDDACALVLLQLLLDQPDAKPRLAKLLRTWPDAGGDTVTALTRAFPTLGPDELSLQKWWTLNVARFAAANRYRGLSAEDTDKELQGLLEFEVVVDKAGKKQRFGVGAFQEFIKLPGGRAAASAQQKATIALSTKANVLLRPVLVDYEQIFALLAKGRTHGIAERIHAAEVYRTAVLQRKTEIADYLNWYEATQMKTLSGAFDDFLRAARKIDAKPPLTPQAAAIAAYLDMLEEEF